MAVAKRTPPVTKEVFSATELAQMLNVSVTTLKRWRYLGRGPAHFRLDALSATSPVRYHRSDVAAWINAQKEITAASFEDNPPSRAAQSEVRTGLEGIAKMRAATKARLEEEAAARAEAAAKAESENPTHGVG